MSKVVGEIATIYNLVENSVTCSGMFRKVAYLEIPRNSVKHSCRLTILRLQRY